MKKGVLYIILILIFTCTLLAQYTKVPYSSRSRTPMNHDELLKKEIERAGKIFSEKLISAWRHSIEIIRHPPFQWFGKKFLGIKVTLKNPTISERRERPYAQLLPENRRYETVNPGMTRLLYVEIDGGYSYGMTERAHPDDFETVTKNFVVVAPSYASGRDYKVEAGVKQLFETVFGITQNGTNENSVRHSGNITDQIIAKYKNQYPDKKAVIAGSDGNQMNVSFRIITLK